MTVQHTAQGVGAPTTAPPSLNAHYLDTASKVSYVAVGTASAADWQPTATKDDVQAVSGALAGKVDAVPGKALSTEDYSTEDKAKLAAIEGSHYKGTYASFSALAAAHPTAGAGDYADVDGGLDIDVKRFAWDATDSLWIAIGGSPAMTAEQVKSLYESNADTNAFTDADKAKLIALEPGGGGGGGGASTGDVLFTARTPGADYLLADGSLALQSAYPALFAELGLLGYSIRAAAESVIYRTDTKDEYGDKATVTIGSDNHGVVLIAYIHLYNVPGSVMRSGDSGATWAQVATVPIGGITGSVAGIFCNNNDQSQWRIFGAGSAELVSSDGGLTWTAPTTAYMVSGAGQVIYEGGVLSFLGSSTYGSPKSYRLSTDFLQGTETPIIHTLPASTSWACFLGEYDPAYYGENTGSVFVLPSLSDPAVEILREDGSSLGASIKRSVYFGFGRTLIIAGNDLLEVSSATYKASLLKRFPNTVNKIVSGYDENDDEAVIVFTSSGIYSASAVNGTITEWVMSSNLNAGDFIGGDLIPTASANYSTDVFAVVKEASAVAIYRFKPGYIYDSSLNFKLPAIPAPEGVKSYIKT